MDDDWSVCNMIGNLFRFGYFIAFSSTVTFMVVVLKYGYILMSFFYFSRYLSLSGMFLYNLSRA